LIALRLVWVLVCVEAVRGNSDLGTATRFIPSWPGRQRGGEGVPGHLMLFEGAKMQDLGQGLFPLPEWWRRESQFSSVQEATSAL
jgi:hypothetical protein